MQGDEASKTAAVTCEHQDGVALQAERSRRVRPWAVHIGQFKEREWGSFLTCIFMTLRSSVSYHELAEDEPTGGKPAAAADRLTPDTGAGLAEAADEVARRWRTRHAMHATERAATFNTRTSTSSMPDTASFVSTQSNARWSFEHCMSNFRKMEREGVEDKLQEGD